MTTDADGRTALTPEIENLVSSADGEASQFNCTALRLKYPIGMIKRPIDGSLIKGHHFLSSAVGHLASDDVTALGRRRSEDDGRTKGAESEGHTRKRRLWDMHGQWVGLTLTPPGLER